MAKPVSPFGDGHAAARIVEIIERHQEGIAAYARLDGNPRRDTAVPPAGVNR